MKIAQVAPLWMSVPPEDYGGTELIIHLLTEGLIERGHEVTLFGPGDSKCSGWLRSIQPTSVTAAMAAGDAYEYTHYANSIISEVLAASDEFDVIHSHLGCAFAPLFNVAAAPVLHTLHIALSVDDKWVLRHYPKTEIATISHFQASGVPNAALSHCRTVYHGIDFSSFCLNESVGDHLAYLGRMGPQKSPADAIRISKLCRMPIVLAGKPQNAQERAYFSREIAPLINGKDVMYVGPVGSIAKRELLRRAAALVFPIAGDEAFGLAMIEAMACGTPVLARRHSSAPEIVDHGVTGFVEDSVEELAARVSDAMQLDRRLLRERAAARFDHRRMVDEYLAAYDQLLAQRASSAEDTSPLLPTRTSPHTRTTPGGGQ